MAVPSWFERDVYFNNKLAQMQESFPAENWTAESLTKAFTDSGFKTDDQGMYDHFVQYGNEENVSPNAYFVGDEYLANQVAYLNQRDKVTTWTPEAVLRAIDDAGLTVWDHYTTYGMYEGVNPSNNFNTNDYMAAKLAQLQRVEPNAGWTMEKMDAAFKEAGMNPIEHYFEYGKAEGVNYTPGPTPTPDGETYRLTTGQDVLVGTAGNDVFYANEFDGVNTLQSGDRVDGGAGTDVLYADLTAGSSFGHILNTVTPEISNVEFVNFRSQQSTDASDGTDVTAKVDAERISLDDGQMLTLGSVNSRADLLIEDVRHNSNETTIRFADADPGDVDYTVYFDPQHLKAEASQTTGTLVAQLIDTVGALDPATSAGGEGHANPLWDNPYTGFSFTLNGKEYTLDFGAYNHTTTGADAPSYAGLIDQIKAAIAADPELAGLGLTVEAGGSFGAAVGIGPNQGTTVSGTQIVISSDQGTLVGGNWVAENGLPPTNSTSATFDDNVQTSCPLIQTFVELDNVGRVQWDDAHPECLPDDVIYGSNAGDLTIGSMANRGGVERFDVLVDGGSWLSALQSTNETLRMVTVAGKDIDNDGTSGGNLYIGDWDGRGDQLGNNDEWTWTDPAKLLTADATPGNPSGLIDVAVFDATGYAGDINIAAAITSNSFDKYFKSVDGDRYIDQMYAPLADEAYKGAFSYNTGNGDDVINMTVNGAIAADVDFKMNINTGEGDDLVAFRYADMTDNQALNQKNLENVAINTGNGDDTVWFYGDNGGSVIINTGAGNDVIYANQQESYTGGNSSNDLPVAGGYNAVFVFNTTYTEVGVAGLRGATLSNDMAIGSNSFAVTGVSAATVGESLNVTVEFKGYSASFKIADVTADMTQVSAEQINHAIINAIANDPTLSALLVAKDGAGHTLLIESLINGEMTLNDLNISFGSTKADGTPGTTGLTDGGWYDAKFGTDTNGADYVGNNSTDSQVVVNGGAGDDIIVLGPNGNLMDVVELGSTDNGNDSLVGFVSGQDKINVAGLGLKSLTNVTPNAMVDNGASVYGAAGADRITGIFSQTAVNALVTNNSLGFAGGQANNAKGLALLESQNADGQYVYTIVLMTYNGTATTATVLGSMTMDKVDGVATQISFNDLTLSSELQSSVLTATYGAADYKAVATGTTTFDGSVLNDTFDALSDANLVNAASAAITAVNGLAGNDTFNVTDTLNTARTFDGGAGNDTFNIGAVVSNLTIEGGSGTDTLNVLAALTGNVTLTAMSSVENINLNNKGDATITTLTTDAVTTLTASKDVSNLEVGTLTAGADTTIDGSLATGTVKVDASSSTASVTLMGGTGAATLTGGKADDTITLSTGAGTVNGGAGHDTITLGAGADTVVLGTGASFSDLNANADNVISFASDDKIDFDSAGLLSGFNSGSFDSIGSAAGSIGSAFDGKIVVVSEAFTGANEASALTALFSNDFSGASGQAVVVTSDGDDSYVWYVDATATGDGTLQANDITLVGTLDGVNGATLTDANFA